MRHSGDGHLPDHGKLRGNYTVRARRGDGAVPSAHCGLERTEPSVKNRVEISSGGGVWCHIG
jgi:hypothetical protein